MKIHKSNEYIKYLNSKIYKENGLEGSIFYSKSYGKFKVNKYVYSSTKHRFYEITFIETGYTYAVRKNRILDGTVMDPTHDESIIVGNVYETKHNGSFKVIEFLGRENSTKMYKVEFIETGTIRVVTKNQIVTKNIKDYNLIKPDPLIGKTFSNAYGDYIVESDFNRNSQNAKLYKVRFINTGYVVYSTKAHILDGAICDPMIPNVYSIGYLGDKYVELRKRDKELYTALYDRWHCVIRRCYDTNDRAYQTYGKLGVSVHPRWHNFSNFYEDIVKMDRFNREDFINGILVIDKDKLQLDIPYEQRVYSKDTVSLLTQQENNLYRDKKYSRTIFRCPSKESVN